MNMSSTNLYCTLNSIFLDPLSIQTDVYASCLDTNIGSKYLSECLKKNKYSPLRGTMTQVRTRTNIMEMMPIIIKETGEL